MKKARSCRSIPRPQILLNNNVKYVTARKGDTYKKISDELGMAPWEIINTTMRINRMPWRKDR
jgi:hypothetical protein